MPFAPKWLLELDKKFEDSGYELFLVGGAIRDKLLGLPVKEYDLATSAEPEETEKLIRAFGCKCIGTVGKRFGTITGNFQGETIEITTYRSESYEEFSRQPAVKYGKDIHEDLSRRDFTINAIAFNLKEQEILDPFDGQKHLKSGLIKAVGVARDRFNEDPLRMLRAIRFATLFDFEIEQATYEAIHTQKDSMGVLSAERISQEMNKLLLADKPSKGIQLLVETGLIAYVLPELIPAIDIEFDPHEHKDIYRHILQVLDNTPPKLELRWTALLHDIAKPVTRKKIGGQYYFLGHENVGGRMSKDILSRLKMPGDISNRIVKIVRLHQRLPNYDGHWTDGGIRRFVRDSGEVIDDLFAFAAADATGSNEKKKAQYQDNRDKLYKRIKELEQEAEIAKIKSPLSGEELMELFHRPAGPWIKPIKEELLRMVLDGEIKESDKDKATEVAKKLIKS